MRKLKLIVSFPPLLIGSLIMLVGAVVVWAGTAIRYNKKVANKWFKDITIG